MHFTNVRRLLLRWILPGVHLVLYILLVTLSGWPPFTNEHGGPDPITPLSLRLGFAINLPAWILSNGIHKWMGPESRVDTVVVVGLLLLPQWWIVGRWAEKNRGTHSSSGILLYFWGLVCLGSSLMLALLGYEALIAENPGGSMAIESGLAAVLWLVGTMVFSARQTFVARR
jgi:hypothetical protein